MTQPFEAHVITLCGAPKPFAATLYMAALAALALRHTDESFPTWLLDRSLEEPLSVNTLLHDLHAILHVLDAEDWKASMAAPLLLDLLAPRLLVPVGHAVGPGAFLRGVAQHGTLNVGGRTCSLRDPPAYAPTEDAFVPLLAARARELFTAFLEALDDIAGAVSPELLLGKWPEKYPLLGAILLLREAAMECGIIRLAELDPRELETVTQAFALNHSLTSAPAS